MRTLWTSLLSMSLALPAWAGHLPGGQPTQEVLKIVSDDLWELSGQVRKPVFETKEFAYVVKVPVTVEKQIEVDGKTVTRPFTEYREESRRATKAVSKMVAVTNCRPVDPKAVKAFDADGRKLTIAEVTKRCQEPTLVVVSANDEMIPDYYAAVFKPGTIILTVPQMDIAAPIMPPAMPAPAPAPPAVAPRPTSAALDHRLTVRPVSQPVAVPQPPIEGEAAPEPYRSPLPESPAPELVFVSREGADLVKIRQFRESLSDVDLVVKSSDSTVARETSVKAPKRIRHSETTAVPLSALRVSSGDGGDVAIDRAKEKLGTGETTALMSTDGRLVDVFWLQNIKPTVLVLRGIQFSPAISHGHGGYPAPAPAMAPAPPADSESTPPQPPQVVQ